MVFGSFGLQTDHKQDASDIFKMFQERHKVRMANLIGIFYFAIRSRPLVFTIKHANYIVPYVHEGETLIKAEFGEGNKNIGWDLRFSKTFYLLTLIFMYLVFRSLIWI